MACTERLVTVEYRVPSATLNTDHGTELLGTRHPDVKGIFQKQHFTTKLDCALEVGEELRSNIVVELVGLKFAIWVGIRECITLWELEESVLTCSFGRQDHSHQATEVGKDHSNSDFSKLIVELNVSKRRTQQHQIRSNMSPNGFKSRTRSALGRDRILGHVDDDGEQMSKFILVVITGHVH
ncbi:hypothetical protein M5K25_025331 [Dendrobium thyrsiflorum]|uniref:Uncharacterized protein n=1 Tax=Dendrobium thyrsiflorum TaxID=117978 RepID=A0ABD0U957_DENTH